MLNFLSKKKDAVEQIAGIVLRHESGLALVIKKNNQRHSSQLIDQREFKYSNGWENLTYDIDEVLFTLEKNHNFSLKKTVFFLYSHLIDSRSHSIKDSYLEKINSLIKENQLDAIGYIDYTEALAKYLQNKEQSPLTALIVEIDVPAITASIYKGGERVFSESVGKTANIAADLEEICKKTQKDTVLPSRIIMYDSSELENESTALITHKWSEDLFIQMPRVEVLKPEEVTDALLYSFDDHPGARIEESPVQNQKTDEVPVPKENDSEGDMESESVAGFVIGKDIKEMDIRQDDKKTETVPDEAYNEDVDDSDGEVVDSHTSRPFSEKISAFFSHFSINSMNIKNKNIFIILIALAVIGGILASTLLLFHKAILTIYYQPETIEKEIEINSGIKIEKSTEKISTSESGEATGTKSIGDKAQGEVTIFNAETSEKTFKKNTQLKTSDGFIFLLSSDVKAAAAERKVTEDGDILTTTSKTKTKAAAQDIGQKYNIKDDVKFTIEGISESQSFARSTGAFSGGTEKEIQVASREDQDKLKKKIDGVIKKEAEKIIRSKQTDGKIISDLTETKVGDEKFSAEIGEEAKNVKLSISAEVSFYSYHEEDMKNLLLEQLTSVIPDGYTLDTSSISYTLADAKKDEKGKITLNISAKAQPKLNIAEQEVFSSIKGHSVSSIRSIIENKFKARGYKINFEPSIPILNSFIPLFSKNLKINVEPFQ